MTLLRTHEGVVSITCRLNTGPRCVFKVLPQHDNFGAGILVLLSKPFICYDSSGCLAHSAEAVPLYP